MKRRISLDFGGGYNTILYSVKENKFFAYEQDREELHRLYGGKQYYWSQSGLSGAGFLEIDSAENDLIRFGYYRTDARSEQRIETVHTTSDGLQIFGYVPIISHIGVDGSKPVVLTDGTKLAFVSAYDMKETLLKWGEIEGRKISVQWFDIYGNNQEYNYYLYNPNHYRGVRVTRFIDLVSAREVVKQAKTTRETLFEQKINIVKGDGCGWAHLHVDGFFDAVWEWNKNPRNIVGEIIGGWQGVGDGLFWRRGFNGIEAFAEIERNSLAEGKYVVPEQTEKYLDFEHNFSVLEWFSRTMEEWKSYFTAQMTKKARMDYVYARQRQGIDTRRLMEQNLEARICIQDSLDTGNCLPGTEGFIRQYGIEVAGDGCISVTKLLRNEKIEEMLRSFSFQKVIHHKLINPEDELV